MPIVRTTVRLNMKSEMPKDAAVNVWHWFTDTPLVGGGAETRIVAFDTALTTFYQGLAALYSGAVDRVADKHQILYANVNIGFAGADDDVVSSILYTRPLSMNGAANSASVDYPAEVALCLSYRGDLTGLSEESGSIRPKSRHRGRLYLGPLNSSTGETGPDGTRPIVAARTQILNGYKILVEGRATAGFQHCVYSPTGGANWNAVEGSVDDAFDTMRSRGPEKTIRQTIAVNTAFP